MKKKKITSSEVNYSKARLNLHNVSRFPNMVIRSETFGPS